MIKLSNSQQVKYKECNGKDKLPHAYHRAIHSDLYVWLLRNEMPWV